MAEFGNKLDFDGIWAAKRMKKDRDKQGLTEVNQNWDVAFKKETEHAGVKWVQASTM